MLSQISWQQYFLGVAALAVVYYAVVLFRYYREDIRVLIRPNPVQREDAVLEGGYPDIMGPALHEPGSSYVESESLEFPDTDNAADSSDDLIKEVGSLVKAFVDVDNKEEFFMLLGMLMSRYAPDDTGRMRILKYLFETEGQMPFDLTVSELNEALEIK